MRMVRGERIIGFADKYLDLSHSQKSKAYFGQKGKRYDKITVGQALNIDKQETAEPQKIPQPEKKMKEQESNIRSK